MLPVEDVPLDTSIMLFAQSFGPAVAIAIAQVLFVNQLSTNLNGLVSDLEEHIYREYWPSANCDIHATG